VRRDRKHSIEGELLVDQKEKVPPIPCEVLYDSVRICLCPQGEEAQQKSHQIAHEQVERNALRPLEASDAEHRIAHQVVRQNDVHNVPEPEPRVERVRHFLKLVVLLHSQGEKV